MERHYGMDGLRIGAFALLILYHVGMVFVPWPFVIKTAAPADWVAVPMLFTNAWRLTLLFVVSGYAGRVMLARMPSARAFVAGRTSRLMLPVLFAGIVIIPVQPWIELVTQHGYARGFVWFVAHDYFRFGTLDGIVLPTWQHLWFVVYLWVYTLVLGIGAWAARGRNLQPAFDRVFGGIGALVWPLVWLILFQVVLVRRGIETHALFDDGPAHLAYLPALLFGFGLAGSRAAMTSLVRRWPLAAALALASYAVVAWVEARWPGSAVPPAAIGTLFRVAREVQTWTSIAALIGLADRYLNRDHRWRATLAEAVFPFYIVHQTVIVVAAFALRPFGVPAPVEFLVLVAATAAGCWGFYLVGRRIRPLRPLIGLKRVAGTRASASAAAHELDADDPWRRGPHPA